jgi:GMP synthase (glutamine-hydrolysing)
MGKVLVFQHGDGIGTGYLGEALAQSGRLVKTVMLHDGDPIPGHLDWDGVVSLGGVMGAYQDDRHPWMAEEKRFLADAVGAEIPVLGICLGCQLLADTLGGRAYKAPGGAEIEVRPVVLTAEGNRDPVMRHLTGPVPLWHGDTWDLPSGAVLLAETERFPQAFRMGSAIGMQPHTEASPSMLDEWMMMDEAVRDLTDHGADRGDFAAAIRKAGEAQAETARRVFGAWSASLG